ncbi:MAG: class II fructose-bisphosphate aldolase [Clostridiales bacterium]|nr:class II fructose-bisphosphate aldolase [Clostridiales bacterium]
MLVNLDYVLKDAQKNGYGVGLFNTTDTDMLEAVISAAEELRAPVIIGTAEVLLPSGELKLIAPALIAAAKRATVPVVVHFDHGLTFDRCMEALQLGFSSIMYDGSVHPYEENLANTREIVKIAHSFGATVEGEIGHVGQADQEDNNAADLYTKVEEAVAYQQATGVDALAISIGTAHGAYKSKPKLDFKRLSEIHAAMDTPLVLHGGSGLTDEDFQNVVKYGISKVNIYTDLCVAGIEATEAAIKEGGLSYLAIRDRKVEAIKQAAIKKMKIFGCENKA